MQLFLFFSNENIASASEGADNARWEEHYLSTRCNQLEVVSFIAPTYDDCWNIASTYYTNRRTTRKVQ